MQLFSRLRKDTIDYCGICKWAVLILLSISILWRGGKSLDMTWILTGVAAMVTIISHTIDRNTGDREVPLFLWATVMGFVLLTILSYIFSTTQNYGLDEVLRTGSLGLLLMWVIRVGSDPDQGATYLNRFLQIFSATVICACAVGILVYIFQPVNRAVGTFFDYRFHTDYWPNAWAEFLLLAWPVLFYWILKDFTFNAQDARSRIELLVRSMVLGLVFGCLLLTYSRGATLVFFAQIALWAGVIYKKTREDFPMQNIIPIAAVLIAVSIITFLSINSLRSQYYEVQNVQEKVTFTASEGTSSVSERTQFWAQSLNLALKKPLLGWGPYSFRFVQPQLQSGVLATSDHPHNVFLKLFMERGVFAGIFFLVFVGIVIIRAGSVLLSDSVEVGTRTFALRMLIVLSLFGAILHNMIDFNLQFVGIVLPFWLLFGMLMVQMDIQSLRSIQRPLACITEMVLASALLLVAFYEGGYLVVSSFGRLAEAQGDRESALVWYDRAGGEIFKRDLLLSSAKLYTEQSEFGKAQESIDLYMESNDQDYRAWKRQGDIALFRGEKEKALDAYTKAFKRGKWNDLGVLHGMIEVYLALGTPEKITNLRPEIDNVMQRFNDAIQRNAHFIALSPNVEQFIAICNRLAVLYPDDAPRYQVMAAKADHHAQQERQRIESRPPGFLW